jgi:hypothetical protein
MSLALVKQVEGHALEESTYFTRNLCSRVRAQSTGGLVLFHLNPEHTMYTSLDSAREAFGCTNRSLANQGFKLLANSRVPPPVPASHFCIQPIVDSNA